MKTKTKSTKILNNPRLDLNKKIYEFKLKKQKQFYLNLIIAILVSCLIIILIIANLWTN